MATASLRKEVQINLTLNDYEARYLMALTQNYMGEDPNDESDEDNELRREVFYALRGAIE